MHPLLTIEAGALPARHCALCRKDTTRPVAYTSTQDGVVCHRCEGTLRTWLSVLSPQQVEYILSQRN